MAVLTADAVALKLAELDGNMAAVGRFFGVTRSAVCKFVTARPALRAVQSDCREAMKDEVESVLYAKAKEGEAWAVCFFLKCQAKDRGYVEKVPALPADPSEVDAYIAGLEAGRKRRQGKPQTNGTHAGGGG